VTVAHDKPGLLVLASTYPRWRDDPEPGFVHELCKRLAERFEVTALVPDAPGADADGPLDGVDVVRYRYAPRRLQTLVNDGGIANNLRRTRWKWLLLPGFVLGQYLAARRLLATGRFAAIHAHWLVPQGLVARAIARRSSIPYVVTSHGGDLFGLRGRAMTAFKRKVAAQASAMTVVSSAMRGEAARIGLQPPCIEVLPMGVDFRTRFVADPGIARERDRLLFVGRLVPKKGLRHLLDAMPAVLARRPHTVLDIIGFGPEAPALREQAARLGIASQARFLGALPQHELPAHFRRASVFVAPFVRDPSGDQEGLPVALMEAIGCGCPVIAGSVPGLQDLLGAHLSEVCVAPEDGERLAAMILDALENPQAAAARAALIRETAAAQVDWEHIAAGYAALIQASIDHAPESHGR
jgi:glycosyltransferase involved in cell wall biosynthesis